MAVRPIIVIDGAKVIYLSYPNLMRYPEEPNKKKLSVLIHCVVSGPFIEWIHLLVEESQARMKTMKEFMESLGKVCEVLNYIVTTSELACDVHPAVGAAVAVVKALYERCNEVKECHKVASSLMVEVASFLPFVDVPRNRLKSNVTSETVHKILVLFEKISMMIMEYSDDTALGIFLRNRIHEVNAYKEELRRLKETFDWCVKTEVWKATLRTEKLVELIALNNLRPVKAAFYDLEKTCFEGTRKDTLKVIEDWSTSDAKLFWLYGPTYSGKTTIAHTVARLFDQQNRLAGCFFCDANDCERRSPKRILPTIAYQLAKWHEGYRLIIIDVLQGRGELDLDAGLKCQYDLLIDQPIVRSTIHPPPKHRPLIVVLDAIDECCESASSRRYLAEFFRHIANAAPWLKVFVTSAKWPKFEECFLQDDTRYLDIEDHFVDLQNDIAVYSQYCTEDRRISHTWGCDSAYKAPQLLSRFYWAFRMHDSKSRSQIDGSIKDFPSQLGIDGFFHAAVRGILDRYDWDENMEPIVRDILALASAATRSPLISNLSSHFLQFLRKEQASDVLRTAVTSIEPLIFNCYGYPMRSVFLLRRVLPLSSDQEQTEQFGEHVRLFNTTLARGCLDQMHSQLKFNICGLASSYLPNSEVMNLASKTAERIPKILRYSSLYWMDHILQSSDAQSFINSVTELLYSPKALFWIEILSLMGALENGEEILSQCADCFKGVHEIVRAATELQHFICSFRDAIATSTPHLYISALTWLSPDSLVAHHLHCNFTLQTIVASDEFSGNKTKLSDRFLREADISVLKGDTSDIASAKYTPDGTKTVSVTSGGKLQIWNAHSGVAICEEHQGHLLSFDAIAWSPDGSKIVSGSTDRKLRIWNLQTGALIGGPLEGHSDWVKSVAYSPDGRTIVSGSSDTTLRIWDAQSGKPIGDSLKGHNNPIVAVAYTPDGSRIMSGSLDNTLRMWDAQTGEPIGKPHKGHGDWVRTFASSQGERRTAPITLDSMLRTWVVRSGKLTGEPPKGRNDSVKTVAYSPDGKRIVSGSWDGTLQVRDTETREYIGEPLKGHKSSVMSVAYSPDGSKIMSGSSDGTIRIWDAHSGTPILVMTLNGSRRDTETQSFLTIFGKAGRIDQIEQTSHPLSIPSDGWIRTLDGGLFSWVPLEYRIPLCGTGQVRIPNNENGRLMAIDWTKVYHGEDWTKIMHNEDS
ncbi:WD40 repeat-like protein [Fomitiporia mediterranea MF3/22]|uniref:WD40 repeat-like protein n=1 Tax=Fomitiporia mediterranea (strain MF3/22) TaxID=694068 RepID=UPI0004408ECC|nr:WD40 repeat-like protein [Fomitiporia mediterranea MF3/22]EJC99701.1 WD40 repeat-like protein [Fomitiporia mediterranea MF3/22]